MKKLILLFLIASFQLACSQKQSKNCVMVHDKESNRDYYTKSDTPPDYPEGIENSTKFITSSFKVPNKKYDTDQKVAFTYIIEKDGTPSLMKLISPLDKEIEAEVIRVLSIMPKYIPAKCGSEPVPANAEISFRLYPKK